MTRSRSPFFHAVFLWTTTSAACVAQTTNPPSTPQLPPEPRAAKAARIDEDPEEPALLANDRPTDEALFADLLDNHWDRIFPNGDRNVGGPQFFKYIYEQLATSHDFFQRYNRFYCGVSGAIVRPSDGNEYELVKVKDDGGSCVVGKYYRCCWPCACDIMKYARVEQAAIRLPNDPSDREETYWVLTIGDPCHQCPSSPCPDLPPEVTTYECLDNVTSNGLRVRAGRLTSGPGRLVFALLHDAVPADQVDEATLAALMTQCAPRIHASPKELETMGGMGNTFVDVARINSDETFLDTLEDLCE